MKTPDNPLIDAACGRVDQYAAAVQLAEQKASVSYLQRKLVISYHHAEELLERMIEDGHITGYSGRCIEKVQTRKIIQLRSRIAELEAQQERKPLTDEQILKMAYPIRWDDLSENEAHAAKVFARAIERAHGIQEKQG